MSVQIQWTKLDDHEWRWFLKATLDRPWLGSVRIENDTAELILKYLASSGPQRLWRDGATSVVFEQSPLRILSVKVANEEGPRNARGFSEAVRALLEAELHEEPEIIDGWKNLVHSAAEQAAP